MVWFSGRKSVPVYVQQEFGFPETSTLRQRSAGLSSAISESMESQRRKADRSQLARQSKLHRDQYDSFLEPAGSESFRVHSGRALHDQRPDIQSMFDDSQFAAAPADGSSPLLVARIPASISMRLPESIPTSTASAEIVRHKFFRTLIANTRPSIAG